jgi:hypothetical protein
MPSAASCHTSAALLLLLLLLLLLVTAAAGCWPAAAAPPGTAPAAAASAPPPMPAAAAVLLLPGRSCRSSLTAPSLYHTRMRAMLFVRRGLCTTSFSLWTRYQPAKRAST